MKKLLIFVLLGIPIIMMAAVDTITIMRMDLFEDPIGADHEIWSYATYQDTTIDTSYHGEVDTFVHPPSPDSFTWDGVNYDTLLINTAIEVGHFNTFDLFLYGASLDSFSIEYHPAHVLADFDNIPNDWRNEISYVTNADSIIHIAVLQCSPFFKWIKWRLIDDTGRGGKVRLIKRIYFGEKEGG